MSWILHLSDPHLGEVPGQDLDDEKSIFEHQPDLETTQRVFLRTLSIMDRFVQRHGRPQLVLVSGDLTFAARDSGFDAFRDLLAQRQDVFPKNPADIVVVPGNHDVVWDEPPATVERYASFLAATRDVGCTTPLLDGIDFDKDDGTLTPEARDHPHLAATEDVLVIPLNSSNYCGIPVTPRGGWDEDEWKAALTPGGATASDEIMRQLKKLRQQDIARISRSQVEALGHYFEQAGAPTNPSDDGRLRIAVLHHQLLPLSTREERKAFESIVNLGMLRQLLRDYGIQIVLHGHKHESSLYWDTIGSGDSALDGPLHRILVVSSPGRFDVGAPTMRAIMLEGPSSARNARIITFAGASAHRRNPSVVDEQTVPLWEAAMQADRRPLTVIAAETAHATYGRIRALFELTNGQPRQNLVCEIDDPTGTDRLPPDYPDVPGTSGDHWLRQLVDWWQLERSELVGRHLAPFNHGERIHTRWGDQVRRAVRILDARADSSRALVQLVSPRETGRYTDDERNLYQGSYPALVLAEFGIVERDSTRMLDCFAYFRKQEMQYWWTVNVAELARLQEAIRSRLADPPSTGRIVTFAAIALWKTTLPRVAVPVVDLLIEEPDRLWGLAFAVAYPNAATATARADWAQILADLPGAGRDEPPRPRVGAHQLRDHMGQLAPLAPTTQLKAVHAALEDLCQQYDALENVDKLNASASGLVRQRVQALGDAVQQALGTLAA
ncbi:MAG: metallophosphoesterase [Solirubrobacteraceae bacterium]